MAQIYKDPITGQQVYDDPAKGSVISATTGQEIRPLGQTAPTPKVGEPIPGTDLTYEEGDIANLGTTPITETPTISTQTLAPVTPTTITEPSYPSITTPATEDFTPAEIQPTTQETELSALIKQISAEQIALPKEEATFRAEEEKRLETEKLQREEADLF